MKKAENLGLSHLVGMSKPDLVVNITRRLVSIDNSVKVIGSGVVEVLNPVLCLALKNFHNHQIHKIKLAFTKGFLIKTIYLKKF